MGCRWRDVKLRAFDSVKHRTYVDLKVSDSFEVCGNRFTSGVCAFAIIYLILVKVNVVGVKSL